MHEPKSSTLLSSTPLMLIATVVGVSVLAWAVKPVMRALTLNPYRVREKGEVYRLLTAGWLHSNVGHLALNMFSLYIFADPAIAVLGTTRFLVLYVTAVVVGFIPTTLRYMKKPQYNSLGASGAIAAVMFSAILLDRKLQLYVMFIPIPVPGIVFALGYLAYSAWQSRSAGDNVNHDAHFSGALYGALLTYALEPARVERTIRSFF